MKKKFAAIFCALVLLVSALPAASALEGESQRALDILDTLNIDVNFKADHEMKSPIPRGEAAVLLLRFSGSDAREPDAALSRVKSQGLLERTVPQDSPISANEFCAALLRLLGYAGASEANGAVYARRIGLTARDYSGSLTWGDTFQILRDALVFPYKDGPSAVQRLVDAGICTRAAASALGLFDKELTARQVADRYMSAAFCIRGYQTEKLYASGESSNEASGFFITPDGIAVTNHHAINDAQIATATLVTGETFPIERVLYYDAKIDIALIRVSRTALDGKEIPGFATLELAGTEDLRPGDVVYTLGNPLGLGLAVSSGIISDVNRDVENYGLPMVMNTADISHGSSGGALLNIYGRVAAVTAGAYTYGNNMYLAVPVDAVFDVDRTAEGQLLKDATAEYQAAVKAEADKKS